MYKRAQNRDRCLELSYGVRFEPRVSIGTFVLGIDFSGAERKSRLVASVTQAAGANVGNTNVRFRKEQASFYLYDHLGNTRVTYTPTDFITHPESPIVCVNEVNSVVDYFPYGKVLRHYNVTDERYLTTQHERDQETDLDYRGARYYDNEVGRFLSLDPLANDYPEWSAYNYVMANPLFLIDPNGMSPKNADGTEETDEYELGTNNGGWTKNHVMLNEAFGDPSGFNGMIVSSISKRPKWSEVYSNYPKNVSDPTQDMSAPQVFESVFGDLYDKNNYSLKGGTNGSMYNACTVRISIALGLSGLKIRADFLGQVGAMKGKGIITVSSKMKSYLESPNVLGAADMTFDGTGMSDADLAQKLAGRKGIYILIANDPESFGASGHCTLWTGKSVIGHSYVSSGTVSFWELK